MSVPDVGSLSHAAVAGAGVMGRGIAQLLLQAGLEVLLIDPDEAVTQEAASSLHDLFTRLSVKGKLRETPDELLARLTTATDLEAAADTQWLFEAAPEDLEVKRKLFARAAQVAPQAVLATNTSTLSIAAIASACQRPEDVIGMHFFNPPGLMRLVEVVPGVMTRPAVVAVAVHLARRLGREPVVARDSPGFIVNRLARPYYLEALRLHADGIPVEQIDALLRSAGFKQGPFELLDLIGLDVNLAASLSVYRANFEEPRYRPHPMQQAMVTAGLLGRKTGRGFYRYDESGNRVAEASPGGAAPGARGRVEHPGGRVVVLRKNRTAGQLRSLLRSRGDVPADAGPGDYLVVDSRLRPPGDELAGLLARGFTVAVSAWGSSASAALGRLRAGSSAAVEPDMKGRLLGFSFVPGTRNAKTRLELMAPLPTDDVARTADAEALERAAAVLARAGFRAEVIPDTAGGVAFRLVALLANEAIGALAEGLATRDELDLAMRLGVNYPSGPLEWAEEIGLRELYEALRGLHEETLEARFAPHPLLAKLAAINADKLPRGDSRFEVRA